MLTLAITFGAALWLLERLAFAILLLWAWGAAVSLADQAVVEFNNLYDYTVRQRDELVRTIV